MCITQLLPASFVEDPSIDEGHIPSPYLATDEMKNAYLYLNTQFVLGKDSWENVVKEFVKEELNITLSGRGSVRQACIQVQKYWAKFAQWVEGKYIRI